MDYIIESHRYIDNARQLLSEKAAKEDGYYRDKKYVKMAGHTAYLGVLVALDRLLGIKKKGRKNVEWYKSELAKTDKKIATVFDSVYDLLHLSLGYDGNPDAEIAQIAFKNAEKIIDWVAVRSA